MGNTLFLAALLMALEFAIQLKNNSSAINQVNLNKMSLLLKLESWQEILNFKNLSVILSNFISEFFIV